MTQVGGPTRLDTYTLTVRVAHPVNGNMINYGVYDKMTGGGIDSEETRYHPGGMAPPVSLGGRKTVDNVVVSRLYRLARDHANVQQLFDAVGVSRMEVIKQPMDIRGNVYGRPVVYNGTLKRVTLPEPDSEGTGAGLIELEMTVEGYPTS